MKSNYYRLFHWGLANESFDSQCSRAQEAVDRFSSEVNGYSSEEVRLWYQNLLDILKDKKYARIRLEDGRSLDVQRIAYTNKCLSFFDCLQVKHLIDFSTLPEVIDKLEFTIDYSH